MSRYRGGNYSFTVDSSFQPFDFKEMIQPLALYKEEYDKNEEVYNELSDKAGNFEYLSRTLPRESKARQIYENYANELNDQAKELARNGLSMNNRRALVGLKRRYSGEIGRLERADKAMKEAMTQRTQMSTKDPSMLYATDNWSIDDFLDEKKPEMYGVSGDDLYKKGALAAQSQSSRIYNDTRVKDLTKYYQEFIQTNGYNPEVVDAFRRDLSKIPGLAQSVDDIMNATGAEEYLSGYNYDRARQNIINGIVDGIIYKEDRKAERNLGVMTASEQDASARGWDSQRLNAAIHGIEKQSDGTYKSIDENEWMYSHDETGRRTGYSDAYKEALKDNLVPGKNISSHTNSTSGGSKPKTEKIVLKEARRYDSDGSVSPITKTADTDYGTKITYAEALERNKAIAKHHPGYENYYEYFLNPADGKVSIIPNPAYASELQVTEGTNPEIPEEGEEREGNHADI